MILRICIKSDWHKYVYRFSSKHCSPGLSISALWFSEIGLQLLSRNSLKAYTRENRLHTCQQWRSDKFERLNQHYKSGEWTRWGCSMLGDTHKTVIKWSLIHACYLYFLKSTTITDINLLLGVQINSSLFFFLKEGKKEYYTLSWNFQVVKNLKENS